MKERLSYWFMSPFGKNIGIFFSFLILSSIVDLYGYFINESIAKAVFILMHHYIIVYFLVLLCQNVNRFISKIVFILSFILLLINYIIDFTCNYVFHGTFGIDTAGIIMGTNSSEILEFLQTFFSLRLIVILIFLLSVILLISFCLYKYSQLNSPSKFLTYFFFSLFITTIVILSFSSTSNWGNVSVTKFYKLANFTKLPDLKQYQRPIDLVIPEQLNNFDIVLIVGESFCRNHSSLYGYEKETNPRLSLLNNDSLLYIFNSVEAPATNTIPAFKSIMSTYRSEFGDSVNWYECETLINIFQQIGFYTYWISNQSQKGAFDNVPTKYSELCDTTIFVGNRFSGICKNDYDELLLFPFNQCINNRTHSRNLYILHMMGSHHFFESRYPKEFEIYTPNDYLDRNINQRNEIAAYDNSVYYNDSIVYEIMKMCKDETIVLYFSDHAIDLYATDPDYLGHARENDSSSIAIGKQIPFFIYVNDTFKRNEVEIVSKIQSSLDKSFNTENIIYLLMDIVGVEFADNNDVRLYSVLE